MIKMIYQASVSQRSLTLTEIGKIRLGICQYSYFEVFLWARTALFATRQHLRLVEHQRQSNEKRTGDQERQQWNKICQRMVVFCRATQPAPESCSNCGRCRKNACTKMSSASKLPVGSTQHFFPASVGGYEDQERLGLPNWSSLIYHLQSRTNRYHRVFTVIFSKP